MRQRWELAVMQREKASFGILFPALGKKRKKTPPRCLFGRWQRLKKSTKKLPTHAWLAIKPSFMLSRIGDAGKLLPSSLSLHWSFSFNPGAEKMLSRFFHTWPTGTTTVPASIIAAPETRDGTLYGIRAPCTPYGEQPTRNAIYENAPTRKRPTFNNHSIFRSYSGEFSRIESPAILMPAARITRSPCQPEVSGAEMVVMVVHPSEEGLHGGTMCQAVQACLSPADVFPLWGSTIYSHQAYPTESGSTWERVGNRSV